MLSYVPNFKNNKGRNCGGGGEDRHVHHGAMGLIRPPLDMIQLTTFVDSACVKYPSDNWAAEK